jgi:hypothetical protein
LPEPLGEPLRDQARGDVGGAAGGKPDEQAYRTARIGLRPRNARDRRQRGSANGQMQKLSAGKFHEAFPKLFFQPQISNASRAPRGPFSCIAFLA